MKKGDKWLIELFSWAIIIVAIALVFSIITSCSKPDIQHSFKVQMAYPPYQCQNLNPSTMKIVIDDNLYIVPVQEVKGGLIAEVEALDGTGIVTRIDIFDENGKMTHWVPDQDDESKWKVMFVPFKQRLGKNINGNVICVK